MNTEQIRHNYYATKHTMPDGSIVAGFDEFMRISWIKCYELLLETRPVVENSLAEIAEKRPDL